jgi:hypothetical protein
MAMNKKEREQFEAMERQLLVLRALRWSDTVAIAPDVPVPTGSGVTEGWLPWQYGDTYRIEKAWSTCVSHGTGDRRDSGSQKGRALYSTEERAFRAVRVAMEHRFAQALAGVDARIAALATPEETSK